MLKEKEKNTTTTAGEPKRITFSEQPFIQTLKDEFHTIICDNSLERNGKL